LLAELELKRTGEIWSTIYGQTLCFQKMRPIYKEVRKGLSDVDSIEIIIVCDVVFEHCSNKSK